MKTALIQTFILVVFGSLLIWAHENLMHTWRVMFSFIIGSMILAALCSLLVFLKTSNKATNRREMVLGMLGGTLLFIFGWHILWACSEEFLIHYSHWRHGPDDTGNSYFYPGNSGMGYAEVLTSPLKNLSKATLYSILPSLFLGLPFGLAAKIKSPHRSETPETMG